MAVFELVNNGLLFDNRLIPCTLNLSSGGGELRRDRQNRNAGITEEADAGDGQVPGASQVTWVWLGWEARTATLDITLTGEDRWFNMAALHAAAYGESPQEHRLIGARTGGIFASPVIIDGFTWDDQQADGRIVVQITFFEVDPETTTFLTEPPPVPVRAEEPAPDADLIEDEDEDVLSDLEADLANQWGTFTESAGAQGDDE